jgi:hypothetical protein
LNEIIDLELGISVDADSAIGVRDCYGKSHRLSPDLVARLKPSLRMEIQSRLGSIE